MPIDPGTFFAVALVLIVLAADIGKLVMWIPTEPTAAAARLRRYLSQQGMTPWQYQPILAASTTGGSGRETRVLRCLRVEGRPATRLPRDEGQGRERRRT
jgi:hypothetical protein